MSRNFVSFHEIQIQASGENFRHLSLEKPKNLANLYNLESRAFLKISCFLMSFK